MKDNTTSNNEIFQSLFQDNNSIMLIIDSSNKQIIEANKSACNFYGYTHKQITTLNIKDLNIHPKEELNFEINNAKQGTKNLFLLKHKLSSGEVRDVEVYLSNTVFNNKKVIFSIIHDVTNYKALEIENHKTTISLIKTENIANIGHWEINLTTKKVTASEGARKIYGLNDENLFISQAQAIPLPKYRKKLDNALENLIKNKKPYNIEFKIKRKNDNAIRNIHSLAEYEKETNTVFGVIKDITKQKHTEEKLKKQNEELQIAKETAELNAIYYEQLFNMLPYGGEVLNTDGIILDCSSMNANILGYTKEELIGKHITNFINKETKKTFQKNFPKIIEGEYFSNEATFAHKSGREIIMWRAAQPIINKNNKITKILVVNVDITKQKHTEEKLKKQNEEYAALNEELQIAKEKAEESNRLKTEFINNMSHEIRTPMNGILGFSQLLNQPDITAERRDKFVTIIQNSGQQLLRIINDILEISQLKTKQVKIIEEEFSLNNLILEQFLIFDLKAKERNIPLYMNKGLPDTESFILTDKTKLNKIISNLLENALKYTNKGFIEVGYNLGKSKHSVHQLEIYVKDTGIGIKRENQKKIFERFSQEENEVSRKNEGLGLGLSIAKENAELLGGEIALESEKDKGSTFTIKIPYKPTKVELKSEKTVINKNLKQPHTVLLVEDEEINYLYLKTLIELIDIDINPIHAKNGKEAIEYCKNNPEIELILMDIKMPIINGIEATKTIRQFNTNIPIIAQTAYSTSDEKIKALNAGCNDFISKPISDKAFNEVIIKYLIKQ